MIKIDSTYDIILTYSPGIHEITGHIFECFDYYLFLRQYYKVGIMFLDSLKNSFIKDVFEQKYIVDWNTVKDDVFNIDAETLKKDRIYNFGKNTIVILTDGNQVSLRDHNIIFSARKQLAFSCLNIDAIKTVINKDTIYLQDQRIYKGQETNYLSMHYVKKLPFKFYRKFECNTNNVGLMYITYNCRKVTRDVIMQYHSLSKCKKTLLVVPYKIHEYENIPNVEQIEAPLKDMFSKFNTYIYTPVARKFDCSPRLVTECFMYGKNVYMNLDYVDLGLKTRYNDCINNLESLNLTDNDDILNIINSLLCK